MNIFDYRKFKSKPESCKNDSRFSSSFKLFEESDNKEEELVPGWITNKKYKYDKSKITKAIKCGMTILISYSGNEDRWQGGRERTILVMNLGINKNTGNTLMRGYHLDGWSVSEKKNVKKVWRLFDVKNIKSMTFTGDFYRLMPKGYKLNDRVMTDKIIAQAKYNEIVKNQKRLLLSGKIKDEKDSDLEQKGLITKIIIRNLDKTIDMNNPWGVDILMAKKKRANKVKICIVKSVVGSDYRYILNLNGFKGNTINMFDEGGKKEGIFKVIDSFTLNEWKSHKKINGKSELPIYLFLEKKK